MYLDVADSANLPYGWSRYAQFSLAVVNQIQPKYTIRKGVVSLYAVLSTSLCYICAIECRGKNVKLENYMPKQHINMGVEVFEHTTILIRNIFMTLSGEVTDFKDFLASGGKPVNLICIVVLSPF